MVYFQNMGRAGNFLFEAATALAYALKHDMEFTVPFHTDNPFWNPIYFPHLRNTKFNFKLPEVRVTEEQHHYKEIPFLEEWRKCNIKLVGYWQSEKYFQEYRSEILKAFAIPYEPLQGFVSIHVRRGDYLQLPNKHPNVPYEYYKQAVLMFVDKGYKSFVVTSDDIEYCKETFKPLRVYGAEFSYSQNHDPIKDLALGSCCEHQICSSSTFAVWQYWLNRNPDKIGVFPELWFTPGHNGLETKDIVPVECIKLRV